MRILRNIAYVVSAIWIFSILWAGEYCWAHGWSGVNGNNIDAFLPAFGLALLGLPAVILSLLFLFRVIRPAKNK